MGLITLESASFTRDRKMAYIFWSSLTVQTIRLITLPIFLALCTLISNPQSFGCYHLSSKGKSIRNTVVLSFEEKEEGRSTNALFFFISPPHVVQEWIRETHIHYWKEDKCDMAEVGCWCLGVFLVEKNVTVSSITLQSSLISVENVTMEEWRKNKKRR